MPRTKGSKNKPKDTTMATKTADRAAEMQQYDQEAGSAGAVAVFQPARLPYHDAIKERFGVDKGQWKVLVEAVFPAAKSIDSIVMVLSYCKARNLDPFKRPVHIVPMWDAQRGAMVETVWPGISELRTTAARTKGYAGCDEAEFGPEKTQTFKGRMKKQGGWEDIEATVTYPEWCRLTVYRIIDGARCKFVGPKARWEETFATIGKSGVPNQMWQDRPEGQLEKCAEAAALRRAFPEELGNDLTVEEMAGRQIHELEVIADVTPEPAAAARDAAPPRSAPPADTEEARDGIPPKRDAAPPRTEQKVPEKVHTPPKDTAPPRSAPPAAKKADTGPTAKPTEPYKISGNGHSYESWCEAYIDLIKTSQDTATLYKWIDVNREPLERLNKGKPSVYAKAKAAAERVIEQLREEKAKQEKKAAKPTPAPDPGMDEPADEMEDDSGDPVDQLPDYGAPEDDSPEAILKWIDKTLATVDAPEDLENVWEKICQQHTVDLIPPDQDEAAGIYRKHEKRLEP